MKNGYLSKQLIKLIVLFYFLASALGLLSAILIKLNGFNSSFSWQRVISSNIFNLSGKFVFLFLAVVFTKLLINRKTPILLSIITHTFLTFLLSLFSSILNIGFSKFVYHDAISLDLKTIYVRSLAGSGYNFFVYFSIITLVYAYYYFQSQKDYEIKQSQLSTQLLDSKIKTLQSQLNPHFLFNTLNDISALMDINVEKSQDAIADLSDLLRQTLNLKDDKFITLENEIKLLTKYIGIEKLRFGDKINHNIIISNNLSQTKVPPLILQPIVENAIKHGFSYNHDKLKILVEIYRKDNCIYFQIENNGEPLDNEEIKTYGTGISNVIERLDSLYDGNFVFNMHNTKQGTVLTRIEIPER